MKSHKSKLEKLLERTIVKFKKTININDFEDMSRYLSGLLECDVRYSKTEEVAITPIHDQGHKDTFNVDVKGYITLKNYPFSSAMFDLLKNDSPKDLGESERNSFMAMKFFTPPGYSLEQLQLGDLAIMDKVRRGIENYFSKKRK